MNNENRPCPIWNPSAVQAGNFGGGVSCWDSPRAGGEYFVDSSALRIGNWLNDNDREKARLTTWLIKQRRLGTPRPVIPYDRQSAYNDHRELKSIISGPDLTVHARADELLKYIRDKTTFIGFEYEILFSGSSSDTMEMLAYTESINETELAYLREYLLERGWLTLDRARHKVTITVAGYAHLADIERTVTNSSQAFVAMWFDESLNAAWDAAIKPAIEDSGYEAIRIDKQEHLNKIDDQIIAEIRRSRFIVADFTHGDGGARGGVYYEAGFAHGLNIPVIFTCREDTIEHIHFDTRQYNHIVWKSHNVLRERLTNRISAVIGDGPLKRESQRNGST